ncbi:hypothetical protein WI29_34095 [Burkholderia ubonensis]|uniref:hypothetical protein n=1 Tax=Burkholderia ubonensis TaxID=101571 RepID=UPI000755C54E|nr:hypothetical protein [Burkholderia ubonensis]AOI70852.1 hypothetical protein WI31_15640 [Burkholderia ubonensis]KUZ07397.1 hypothetical protein WI29_34095 [Burkholderia ubonensis]KUZ20637.1 hypothetical protein WI30_01280 [Burkholderia ubonensis]KUZ33369.1 hypothetical protein WI32_19770 [Burkholderia ubonensis]KUZ44788.1 hypothetical protein WI33_27995 [Burkholderia ubonensis]
MTVKKRREYQGTRSESRDVSEFFGKGPYKSNVDDRPKRTPRDRGTGTSLERKLRGKVIG